MNDKNRNKMTKEKDVNSKMDETNMNSKKEKEDGKVRKERLEELYVRYGELITQVAAQRVRDYHYAQTICQEVFIKLFYKMDMLMDDDLVKAWLIVVADTISKEATKKVGTV